MLTAVTIAAFSILFSFAPSGLSAASDSHSDVPTAASDELLRGHTYELTHEVNLNGPGLEFLLQETRDAQFVLVGEPHNTDQVNQFVGMLFRELHDKYGFDHLVTEQDALIMDRLAETPARGQLDAVRSLVRRHPDALHYSTDAELELLASIGRLSRAPRPLWGVDRIHDAALALESLLEATHSPDIRRQISDVLRDIRRPGASWHIRAQGERFDSLISSLKYQPETPTAQLLHAIRVSREDHVAYQIKHEPGDPWGFLANERREELMKTRFIEHYRQELTRVDPLPRAIAKLGHWHVMRGHGPGSVPTLGSFLVDVARFNGMSAISISIQLVNKPDRHWSITDYPEYDAITGAADSEKWVLVDLRPLRGYIHSGFLTVSKEARETIFGFDLLLLLGGTNKGKATWAE